MVRKKVVRLVPAEAARLDDIDRHYLDVHFRFAASTFDTTDAVVSYHTHRALGRFDLTAGFRERPDAWRFVVTRWHDEGDGGHAVGWLDERIRNLFFEDRRNGISDVKSYELDEEVVVDHRSGQLTSAKYLFLYGPDQFGPGPAFDDHYDAVHRPAIAAAAEAAVGLRLLLTNRVEREAETAVGEDGRSGYTGGYLPESGLHRIEEYWFDSERHAEAFFARPEVLGVLRDSVHGKVPGYHVDERCGIDRREAA